MRPVVWVLFSSGDFLESRLKRNIQGKKVFSEDKQSRATTLGKSTAVYTVSAKEDSTAINNYELEAWPPRELIKRHLPHFSSLSVFSLCSVYPFCYSLSLNTKKNGKTCKYKEENCQQSHLLSDETSRNGVQSKTIIMGFS